MWNRTQFNLYWRRTQWELNWIAFMFAESIRVIPHSTTDQKMHEYMSSIVGDSVVWKWNLCVRICFFVYFYLTFCKISIPNKDYFFCYSLFSSNTLCISRVLSIEKIWYFGNYFIYNNLIVLILVENLDLIYFSLSIRILRKTEMGTKKNVSVWTLDQVNFRRLSHKNKL